MSAPVSPIHQDPERTAAPFESIFPDDAHAIIYRPCRSAMTSGKQRTREWKLRFERRSAPFIEPLMGWTGGDDPLAPVELSFPSLESAVAYARRQGLSFSFTVDRNEQAPPLRLQERRTTPLRAQRWRLEWVERTLGPELRKSDLDPALRYADPSDVLADPALSDGEKLDILHRWAVDAYLIELALSRGEATDGPSRLADVMDALAALGRPAQQPGEEHMRAA